MIVLNTNVVLEPLKSDSEPSVAAWRDAQVLETLYLSAISLAELRYGVAILSEAQHKWEFDSRFLPFDASAATAYATLNSFKLDYASA